MSDAVTLDELQGQTLLGNPPRVSLSADARRHITKSGNWTSVYAERLPPTVESEQCKTGITKKVDIRVSSFSERI